MKSWKYIIECIEKLEILENGAGTEIEFTFKSKEYGIVSYRSHSDFMCEDIVVSFSNLTELGKSDCYGF